MIIKLSGRNTLKVLIEKNEPLRMILSDHSRKINFRRRLKNFLKSEEKSARLISSEHVRDHYTIFTKRSLTTLDALRLACWLERKKVGSGKSRKN